MKQNKDLFAPPTEDELNSDLFSPPSPEELGVEPSALSGLMETGSDLGVGAAQGATFNLSDEILAGLKSAYDVASTEKTTEDLSKLYDEYVKMERERVKLAEERSPVASMVGNIGGAIGTGALTGGASLGAKGVSLLPKIATLAGLGAAEGGLAAYGADQDILQGAKLGGLLGGGIGGISAGLGAAKKGLGKIAEKAAEKSDLARAIKFGAETGESLTKQLKENIAPKSKETAESFIESLVKPLKKTGAELSEEYKKSEIVPVGEKIINLYQKLSNLTRGKENLLNDPSNLELETIFNKHFSNLDESDIQKFLESGNPEEKFGSLASVIDSTNISVNQLKNFIDDLEKFSGSNSMYKGLVKEFSSDLKTLLPEKVQKLKKEWSGLAEAAEKITPGGKTISELGGLSQAEKDLAEKLLNKDIYHLSDTAIKKSTDPLLRSYNELLEEISQSKTLTDQQKMDIFNQFKNVQGVSKDLKYLTKSTQDPMLTDISARSQIGRELGLSGLRGVFRLAESAGQAANKAKKGIEAVVKPVEKLGQVGLKMSGLFKKQPQELAVIGEQIGGSLGQGLKEAALANDVAKMNSILFSILQSPSHRAELREQGYEE